MTINQIIPSLKSSENNLWATPQHLFDVLNDEFHFTLDACANRDNFKLPRYYGEGGIAEDGLTADWTGETVYMNPPYGRELIKWVKKAHSHTGVIVALLPNRTDTRWFQYCMNATEIRFIKGRLKFGDSDTGAPFGSMIVIWGLPTVPVMKFWDVKK